jgi:hypothetical protein
VGIRAFGTSVAAVTLEYCWNRSSMGTDVLQLKVMLVKKIRVTAATATGVTMQSIPNIELKM